MARNEALVLGAALEQGLPVPLGARVARDGEADEPRNGGARLDVGPLGQDIVFGCGQRGDLVDILGFRGDARGLDGQARSEVGTVHDAARRPLDVAVVGRGDAIGDGDRVGRPALNSIEALVEAQVRRLLLVREGTRDRQFRGGRGRGNLREVDAAGGRVARHVHALAHAVQAGHVRHGPHGAPLQLAGFPGGAEVAGLRGVPGQDGAGLGDDELRLTRNEGLVGRGRGAASAVAGGGQLRVREGARLHEAVGGHERRVRGSGHAGPAIADPRREGEGRDLPADALEVLGDRLGDAHVALLLEVAVHAAEGGGVFLRRKRRHRFHARRGRGGAVAVRVGHETVDEEAVRDSVDHDGLLRRGLTDRQDVVGVRGRSGNAGILWVVSRLPIRGGRIGVLVDVHTPLALADVTVAVPVALVPALASLVGGSGVAAVAVRDRRRLLVGTSGAGHRGRLRIVDRLVLVEGEGLFQVADANIEAGVHPVLLGEDGEVVVAHGPDQEGLAQCHRSGIVGLVAQGTRRGGRDPAGVILTPIAPAITEVIIGLAASNIRPVVPALSHRCLEPRLNLGGAGVLDRRLVRVARVVARLAAHNTEVAVVGHEGCAVSFTVVDDGSADTPLGAIKRGRGDAGRLKGSLGVGGLDRGGERGQSRGGGERPGDQGASEKATRPGTAGAEGGLGRVSPSRRSGVRQASTAHSFVMVHSSPI